MAKADKAAAQGDALARTLGGTLRRGHGSIALAHTLPHAVYRAAYAEINARSQRKAHLAREMQDKILGRAYELRARKAGGKG